MGWSYVVSNISSIANINTLEQRRDSSRVAWGMKLVRGVVNAPNLAQHLAINPAVRQTRQHLPYTIQAGRSLAYQRRSIIADAEALNYYSDKVDLSKSSQTTKSHMKKRFEDRRFVDIFQESETAPR